MLDIIVSIFEIIAYGTIVIYIIKERKNEP